MTGLLFSLTFVRWAGAAEKMAAPLTLEKIRAFVAANRVTNVETFVAALPDDYHRNAVLVPDSKSLQKSTPALPRQILFGADAHLIFGIGAVPEDPNFDTVEFAELLPTEGRYRASRIHFPPGEPVNYDVDSPKCRGCHGARWRPIWGPYPKWPGVYGDEFAKISAADQAGFTSFLENLKTVPRLAHLDLAISRPEGGGFEMRLKGRRQSTPNTVFGNTLGSAVAANAYAQMLKSPNYPALRWLLLDRALNCSDDDVFEIGRRAARRFEAARAADPGFAARYESLPPSQGADGYRLARYRLLGVDPASEFLRTEKNAKPRTEGNWLASVLTLYQLVEFQVLADVISADAELGELFGEVGPRIRAGVEKFTSTDADRRARAAAEYEGTWYNFDDLVAEAVGKTGSEKNGRACARVQWHLTKGLP